jgi:lipopolysaccharide/colanic/teichoic acid biosynthesis glycosyltransferase
LHADLGVSGLAPDVIVLDDASLPWAATWEAVEEALRGGAWVGLSAARFPELATRIGAEGPAGATLVMRPLTSRLGEWAFRLRDVLGALVAFVLLAPAFVVIALLVVVTSGRPVLHAASVIGRGGKPFRWRKFRTMRLAEAGDDEARAAAFRAFAEGLTPSRSGDTKVVDERRVTGVGSFLRRYSLDELPQLWNVLRGEMALVGPRPCLPYEFDVMTPWQRARVDAKPGLTGLWQVYGRSRVGFEEAMAMDRLYVLTRGWWLDLGLIARTFGVMAGGRGGR